MANPGCSTSSTSKTIKAVRRQQGIERQNGLPCTRQTPSTATDPQHGDADGHRPRQNQEQMLRNIGENRLIQPQGEGQARSEHEQAESRRFSSQATGSATSGKGTPAAGAEQSRSGRSRGRLSTGKCLARLRGRKARQPGSQSPVGGAVWAFQPAGRVGGLLAQDVHSIQHAEQAPFAARSDQGPGRRVARQAFARRCRLLGPR